MLGAGGKPRDPARARGEASRLLALVVALLATGLGAPARAGPGAPDPPLAIFECHSPNPGTYCWPEDGALWWFAREYAYPPRAYPFVYRYDQRDGSLAALPVASEQVPERVRVAAAEFAGRPHDWRAVCPGKRDECQCGAVLRADTGSFEVKPTALLGLQNGRYHVYLLPRPGADGMRRLGSKLRYGLPEDAVAYLLDAHGEEGPASILGPHVRVDDRVYFGLLGGFSEGTGSFGGLAVFDLASPGWKIHRPDLLLEVSIDEILRGPFGALWLGTAHHGEYGASGIAGLVRFDPATDSFRSYTEANSALPDDVIRVLRRSGRQLWVATEEGLSCLELDEGRWRSFLWRAPKTAGGAFELVPATPAAAPETCTARPPSSVQPGRFEPGIGGANFGTPLEPTSRPPDAPASAP